MHTFMKTAAFATAAVAVATAAPAFAATQVKQVDVIKYEDGSYGADFNQLVQAGSGTVTFNLVFPVAGVGSLSFSSSLTVPRAGKSTGVRITGATFDNSALGITAIPVSATSTRYAGGADVDLSSKTTLPLVISYIANSAGNISGNVTFGASAVPEPASWALMIGGFGIVGGFMRRRSTRVTKTTFAVA